MKATKLTTSPTLTLAALMGASTAGAAIHVVNTPLTVDTRVNQYDSMPWDIDGAGTAEDALLAASHDSSTGPGDAGIVPRNNNSFQLATSEGNLATVTSLGSIGSNYFFSGGNQRFYNVGGSLISDGWALVTQVDGYIGFRFNNNGTNYGVAKVSWGISGTQDVFFTIEKWAWNDVSGESIPVSALVPEPATTALGLAGLALGAAGLARWRKQKVA